MTKTRRILSVFVGALAFAAFVGGATVGGERTVAETANDIVISSDFTNGGAFRIVERNGMFQKSNVTKDEYGGNADYGLIPASSWGDPVSFGDGSITYRIVSNDGYSLSDLDVTYDAYLGCCGLGEYYGPSKTNVIVSVSEDNVSFEEVFNMHNSANGEDKKNVSAKYASYVSAELLADKNKTGEFYGNTSNNTRTKLDLDSFLSDGVGELYVRFELSHLTYDELEAEVLSGRGKTLIEYLGSGVAYPDTKRLGLSKSGVRIFNINLTAKQTEFDETVTDFHGDDFTKTTLSGSVAAASSGVSTDSTANAAYGLIPAAAFADPASLATGSITYKVDSTASASGVFKHLRFRADYLLKELPNADLLVYVSDSLGGAETKVFHAWDAFQGKAYRDSAQVVEIDLSDYAFGKESVFVRIELKYPTVNSALEGVALRLFKTEFVQWDDLVPVTVTVNGQGRVESNLENGKIGMGEALALRFFPETGYYVSSVLVNGQSVTVKDNACEVENISAATEIAVTFSEISELDVQITVNGEGQVTSSATDGKIEAGSDLTFAFQAADGYILQSVTVNGETVELVGNGYTVYTVNRNVSVVATFRALEKYDVTVTNDSEKGAFASNAVDGKAEEFSDFTFTVVAKGNYYVKKVTVNGQELKAENGAYTVKSVTSALAVAIEYGEGAVLEKGAVYNYGELGADFAQGSFQTEGLSPVSNVDYKGEKRNAITSAAKSVGFITYKYVAPEGKTFAYANVSSYARLFDYYLKLETERVEYYVSYDNVNFKCAHKSLITMDGANSVVTELDLDGYVFGRDTFYLKVVIGCSNDQTWTNMNWLAVDLGYEKTTVTVHYGEDAVSSVELDRGMPFGLENVLPPEGFVSEDNKVYTDAEYTTEYDGSAITKPTELYVKGGYPTLDYTITYVLNGGENSAENPQTYSGKLSETVFFQAPTREGYHFLYWCFDEELTDPVFGIGKGMKGNLTLYAKWVADVTSETGAAE